MPSERVVLIRQSLETFADPSDRDDMLTSRLKRYSVDPSVRLDELIRWGAPEEGRKFREFLVFDPKGCQADGMTADYTCRLIKRLARPNCLNLESHESLTVADLQDLTDPELTVLCGNRGDVKIVRRLFGRATTQGTK